MPNRVLVFGEYGSRNGGENSFLAIAPTLIDQGWEFQAAVPGRTEFSGALEHLDIRVTNLSLHHESGIRKSQVEIRHEIAEIIAQIQPDLIHCNSLSTSRLIGPIASEMGIASLGYLRDILKLSKKAVADINQLDRIIAVSEATKKWHCDQGVASDKTFVVYNGVNSDVFFPTLPGDCSTDSLIDIRTERNMPPDSPIILFVGQIGMRKGVDVLLDAFLTVAAAHPESHLLIVGQRHSQKQEAIDYETKIKEKANASEHSSQIHWLGTRTDVPELMRAATILVHPARQEPLGRVLLEAASSGLPIVTTSVGGSPEIMAGWETLLVRPDDPAVIAETVLKLLNDPEKLPGLGSELRARAHTTFSVFESASQLNKHYAELTSKPNSHPR